MADIVISNIDVDGEVRPFERHGCAQHADAGAVSLVRSRFEPGWRWSADVASLAGTDSCAVRHHGYVLSGAMRIRMDDGTEAEAHAGDLVDVPAGHDAWVVGEEPCVLLDFSPDAARYAVSRPAGRAAAENEAMALVRRGYAAFNTGDMATLGTLFAADVTLQVPGHGPLAGHYKGREGVLGYYARLVQLTDGTFRVHLVDVHGDDQGHVVAFHQTEAVRKGVRRVSRGSLLLTFVGDKVTDLLQLHGDLPGDDAFLG